MLQVSLILFLATQYQRIFQRDSRFSLTFSYHQSVSQSDRRVAQERFPLSSETSRPCLFVDSLKENTFVYLLNNAIQFTKGTPIALFLLLHRRNQMTKSPVALRNATHVDIRTKTCISLRKHRSQNPGPGSVLPLI